MIVFLNLMNGIAFGKSKVTLPKVSDYLINKCTVIDQYNDMLEFQRNEAVTFWVWTWIEYHITKGVVNKISNEFRVIRFDWDKNGANHWNTPHGIQTLEHPLDARPNRIEFVDKGIIYRDNLTEKVYIH